MEYDNRPIGIFDSGLGGLTVTAEIMHHFPNEDIVYLGDTARVPYGDKSVQALLEFSRQDSRFLLDSKVKAIIVACNTVSAVAIPMLREFCGTIPVTGVIEAGVRAAIRSGAKKITVIGTRTTIRSGAYARGILEADPGILVHSIACPLFVPLAEEGITEGTIAENVVDLYLSGLRKNPPEALLLGCTHYPLFRKTLEAYFDGKVRIIDSATSCAELIQEKLKDCIRPAAPDHQPLRRYYVTDLPAEFHTHAGRFLGEAPGAVEKIQLESL